MRIGALKAKRLGAETVVTQQPLPELTRYGLAALSVGLALGASLLLQHFHFPVPAAPLLLFAVAISSWYGGPGPAVLAVILSITGFYWYFVEPVRTIYIYPSEIPYFVIFAAFAWLISWFSTIRRRAEAVLREQANLLNLTHDAIFVMNMEGVIKYWNRGAEERYGWTAEQAANRVVHDLLKTVFPGPIEEIKAEVKRTGRWKGELVHTRKDGSLVVVASRWSLQRDETGAPVAILETNNDITESKKEELELRKFVSLAENSAEFIGMCDTSLIPFYVNPSGLRLVGLDSLEQVARTAMPEFFFPEDRRFITEEFFPRVVREGRAEVEIRFRHFQTSEPIWMVYNVFHITDTAGRPVGLATVSRDITERKRAEETLRRLNRELGALSNCNQALLRASDEPSLLQEICRIICQEAGYRPVWVSYVEHDQAKSMRPVAWAGTDEAYLIAARISWSEELERGRGPTGTAVRTGKTCCIQDFATDARVAPWRDLLLQGGFRSAIALPLKDEQGNVFGSLTMHSAQANGFTPQEIHLLEELAGDLAFGIVTLRSRVARERAEQEVALLGFALDKIREAAFLLDDKARFHYVNEEGCRVLGYTRAELFGLSVPDINPEFPEGRWSDHWRDLKAQRSLSFESRHRTRDGRTFPVEIRANYFEYGGRAYNLALVRDITERKRAEDALRRSEVYLAEAQTMTHTGSWAQDGTTRMTLYWSEETFRMWGFDPQQGLPTWEQIVQRIHPQDLDKHKEASERALHEKVDLDFEYRIVLPDGTVKHLHTLAHPVLSPAGEVLEVVGTTVDITDRKRAEEERERLRQLEAELAHIDRVSILGELAASIAHEVNQPLAGVVSNASAGLRWLATDVPNLEEAREALRRAVRDGKRAGEVIQRIRALTRKTATARERVDLNQTIGEVLALVGDEAKRKSVIIRRRFADDLSPVLGDQVQFQQVVLNLIMNGIEAMSSVGERARELVITTRHIEPDQVQVTVKDSGVGIAPERIGKIFDSFYTTKPGGMGMGLSISRSILEAHGGRLWATANDGPGATFYFTLPKYHEEEAPAGVATVS
ncbi:MAG TPA: PAS domain S-box protein [Bryobacteraceae bacterium]|nr:PAS domain S-box protein [Bryobacteraceae bacterium]